MDSVTENEFRDEQKSPKVEVRGEYNSAKEDGGAYLAPTGSVPSRVAPVLKGKLGATPAVGREPLPRVEEG